MLFASLLMIVTLPFTYPLDGINLSKLGELGVDLLFDPCVSLIPRAGQNSGISKSSGLIVQGTPKYFARCLALPMIGIFGLFFRYRCCLFTFDSPGARGLR